VRVTTDQAVIWQPGFATMATVVMKGAVLDVVARRAQWYEVRLPSGEAGATGMIAVEQVEPVEPVAGSQLPPSPTSSTRPTSPSAGIRGFGTLGYEWFDAHKGFDAVLNQPGGVWFGGGAEFRTSSGLFIQGSVERFRRTGERVYVLNDKVFKLGIPDTVTITPVGVSAGYRFVRRNPVPYLGGGVGRYFFSEKAQFADPSDNVDRQFTSYDVVVGVEFRGNNWLATALEALYRHVPTDLTAGALSVFGEQNLGGVQFRVKVLVGR
jgi:opacity protein-like surface antigen